MDYQLAPLPPLPSLTVQLIAVSIAVLQRTLHHNRITTQKPIKQTYDFVIVGSGTAGSILAGRLTENPNISVLVLEYGGPQTVTTDAPSHARQQFVTDVDWAYRTSNQTPNAGNAYDGRTLLPRGRVVGGSHNLNFLVYSRGNKHDYDSWANVYGATGWNYSQVLPYFLKSENNVDQRIVSANPNYHSTQGPVTVQTPKNPDPIITILMNIIIKFGYPVVDQNGPSQLGINYFQQTIYENNTRSTTASAYLEPNIGRPNLQVLTNAFATRVLFNTTRDSNGKIRAIGIQYEHMNQTRQVYASREVILTAGSINTPQLLMLSGVGPRDHLSHFGINTLVDLPVGFNLKDHVYVQLDYEVLNSSLVTSGIEWNLENMYRNFINNAGPLSQLPFVYMYLNSQYNNQTDWPDIQIDFNMAPLEDTMDQIVAEYPPETRDAWRKYYQGHVGDKNRLGVLCFHYRPHSIGRLYLNSTNHHQHPILDTRYLTDPYDINAMVEVISRALEMTHMYPFNQYIKLYRQPIPGCQLCPNTPIWKCRSYMECYARAVTHTVGHQVGTCKMGNSSDTVVDPRMRVRGVNSLRVIDGSIYPEITNGNTNAPVMMFAEYGVDMLRQDNNIS